MAIKRKFKRKTYRKKDLVAKCNKSMARTKNSTLMVNPKNSLRLPVPDRFRTTLTIVHGAREAVGAPAINFYEVFLNQLYLPLATANAPPGVMMGGASSTSSSSSPTSYLQIIGNNATAGLYSKYVVLNVRYKVTYFPLALADAQYVSVFPNRDGVTLGSITQTDDYPYSKGPKMCVGYNSTSANTITGTLNLAKFLGYKSDDEYATDDLSIGDRLTGPSPASAVGTGKTNLVRLRVARATCNGTILSFALPYSIELKYDVIFTKQAGLVTE